MHTPYHINKQVEEEAMQTNRFVHYQVLGKETNNINKRQLLGSQNNVIGNADEEMTTNIRHKKRSFRYILFIVLHRRK